MEEESLDIEQHDTIGDHEVETEGPEPFFSSLEQFVDEYLTYLYPKNVTTRQAYTWCKQWWKHPAASLRFHALWAAWEDIRINGGERGLAEWIVNYADPIMSYMFSEEGPFEGCHVERGHVDVRPNADDKLPTVAPPPYLFEAKPLS